MVATCPICGSPLTGQQTVCSPKCRTKRARQTHEADRRERDAKVSLLLRTVIEGAQEARELLKESPPVTPSEGVHHDDDER
jgi:predicted nucleic acid-binding Zn ribbon protein